MEELKDLIKKKRIEIDKTLEQIADECGVSKATVSRWESGEIKDMRRDKIVLLAKALNTTPAYLMGWEDDIFTIPNIMPLPEMKRVPLLGTIACGEPILAQENIDGYIDVPADKKVDFCLRCKGDSMINARIFDGDVVYIHSQPDVEDGEIAAVLIGEEATLKRVYRSSTSLTLRAANPTFPDMVFSRDEQIRILGRALVFLSAVR